MSTFLTVGVTHHDTALGQLERVAECVTDRAAVQAAALAAGCAEVMLVSTCSRIELHAVVDLADDVQTPGPAIWAVADRLVGLLLPGGRGSEGGVSVAFGDDGVRHLFELTAGLGSRITGETEVRAQVRSAARAAMSVKGEPHRLRRMATAALKAARLVAHGQPDLVRRGLLAERAALRALAGHAVSGGPEAVVVGAGTMGRQVVEALSALGCRVTLLSRTTSAKRPGPRVRPLGELPARLASADMVFVATSAGRRILRTDVVAQVMAGRPGRALTLVDLSLPRNVDPRVADVAGVRLLDLDDLSDRGSGMSPDTCALAGAMASAHQQADAYCGEIRSRRAGPVIRALREQVEDLCLHQLRRTSRGLDLSEEVLTRMASAAAGAVLHGPVTHARQAGAADDEETLAVLAAAFGVAARQSVETAPQQPPGAAVPVPLSAPGTSARDVA
jgi:glutamyl-tRNA reductase